MNGNKIALCGCVFMAVFSLSGWAQEPATEPAAPVEPVVSDAAIVPSEPVEHVKIAPSIVEPEPESEAGAGPWMVGTRIIRFELQDDTRGTRFNDSFMGSVTEIKDEQDDFPNKLFVQYRLVESAFWVGISYDHLSAETWDGYGSDGSVELEGLIPYVQARWNNETRAVPYIEAGLAFYEVSFDESSGWSNDGSRTVKLDDSVMGMEIAGGVSVQVYEGLSIDLYARYMDVEDIKGGYYIDGYRDGDAIFTMSYMAYGLGVQYQF